MLELKDGPCEGTYLVKRAPIFLRAVKDAGGASDILDQVEDMPRKSETVYIYKLEGTATWVHLKMTRRSQSGFYAMGSYRYMPEVDGQALRDNEVWQNWAMTHLGD